MPIIISQRAEWISLTAIEIKTLSHLNCEA